MSFELAPLIEKLKQVSDSFSLESILEALIAYQGVLQEEEKALIFQLFRDKILEHILKQGHILETKWLALMLFMPKDINKDERFFLYYDLANKHVFQTKDSAQNSMLLDLQATNLLLMGEKEKALEAFIIGACQLPLDERFPRERSVALTHLLEKLEIPFELTKNILLKSIETDFYFALPLKEQRSILNWHLHVFWNVKGYCNHALWKEIYQAYLKIFDILLQQKRIEELLYIHFLLYHIGGNGFTCASDWELFNKEVSLKACKAYEEHFKFLPQRKLKTTKSKKRIGILKDRLVENSPTKVELSFFASLLKNKDFLQNYEIKIYLMELIEKSPSEETLIQECENLGIEVLCPVDNSLNYYNSHYQKVLDLYTALEEVDILISPNNGYGISDCLLSIRACPIQIFYSHSNSVYNVPNIDAKISHIDLEGFEKISFKMLEKFHAPYIPKELIEAERARYQKDSQLIGVISRLIKCDSLEYLKCIAEILEQEKSAEFLFCGIGNTQGIHKKLLSINPNLLERCHFIGYVNSAIYGHVLDLWCGTFPMVQGESQAEFSAKKGLLVVMSLETHAKRNSRIEAFLNSQAFISYLEQEKISKELIVSLYEEETNTFIAFDSKDYVKKALDLLRLDFKEKEILKERRYYLRQVLLDFHSQKGVKDFLNFLKRF
ncbi:hypothetical protein [Helicobacter cetorum]|uniref:hypothetical protein n=1 Tax=Helicobacter cetorum TaxID=138563 RepID=UPI000CF0692E|nr:hypothetical protein [Helicobacter cetorum]